MQAGDAKHHRDQIERVEVAEVRDRVADRDVGEACGDEHNPDGRHEAQRASVGRRDVRQVGVRRRLQRDVGAEHAVDDAADIEDVHRLLEVHDVRPHEAVGQAADARQEQAHLAAEHVGQGADEERGEQRRDALGEVQVPEELSRLGLDDLLL